MRRWVRVAAVLLPFLVACADERATSPVPDEDEATGTRIHKVTQQLGVAPLGFDPNQIQLWVATRDHEGKVIRWDFFHGRPGHEAHTIYDDYVYAAGRLSRIDHHVFYDGRFVKTRIDTFDIDERGLARSVHVQGWSEITDSWTETTHIFVYDDQERLIEQIIPGNSRVVFSYDESGNVWRQELHPLFDVDYEGPITTTYAYDDETNPFQGFEGNFWLPMGNGIVAPLLVSRNNIVAWETVSPQPGAPISRSRFEYTYRDDGLPTHGLETVTTPLTQPMAGTVLWSTKYEYGP